MAKLEPASVHVLERRQVLERSIQDAFAFYADARNLEAITPPWLGFRIVTPGPIEMAVGAIIEYRLRLHPLFVRRDLQRIFDHRQAVVADQLGSAAAPA